MPSTCSVSGNLQDLTGTGIAGFAVFTLANYGSNVPRVVGTTMIASPKKVFQANGSGAISGNIWGNDNISPAGTLYLVTIEDASRTPIASYFYNVAGSTFNLNTATPVTAVTPSSTPLAPALVASVNLSNQSSAVAATALLTPGSTALYRIGFYFGIITASASGTLGGWFSYTDPDSGTGFAIATPTISNTATPATTIFANGDSIKNAVYSFIFRHVGGIPINYQALVTGAAPTYNFYIRLEQL